MSRKNLSSTPALQWAASQITRIAIAPARPDALTRASDPSTDPSPIDTGIELLELRPIAVAAGKF